MASDIHLQHLDFQDNMSLSSMELSPSSAPHPPATIISNNDGFPPAEHPLTPLSHHANSPNLLQVPTLYVTNHRRNAAYLIDDINPISPLEEEGAEDDNEEGRPHSILSILSISLSPLSFHSAHSHPRHSPPLDTDGQSSHFSFSSSNGIRNVFKGLVHRSRRTKETTLGSPDGEMETKYLLCIPIPYL